MISYDWSSAGATAIVVPFPEAEPAIGGHRRIHTPSGAQGMLAHATLIAPFIHAPQLTGSDYETIRGALAPFDSFDVTLASFGLFEEIGCLYLVPEPPAPFVGMSEALLEAYPEIEYPPAGLSIVPHVTIGGHLGGEHLTGLRAAVAPSLPIRTRADRVVLVERGDDGRWFDREVFPLSSPSR